MTLHPDEQARECRDEPLEVQIIVAASDHDFVNFTPEKYRRITVRHDRADDEADPNNVSQTLEHLEHVGAALAAAPSLHKEGLLAVQVAGQMEQTFAEHTRRLGILIAEEQEKPLPNNVLIAALCDSIRLAREATAIISEPAALHKEGAG